jgi:Spy/CpxP family protein refolding chaperone
MKVKTTLVLAIAGFFLALAPSNLFAQRLDGKGLRGFNNTNIPGMTDQQKERLEEIRKTHIQAALPLHEQLTEKNAALRTLTKEENLQEANSLLEEIYALRLELAKNRMESRIAMRQELNEEQKQYLDTQIQERWSNAGNRSIDKERQGNRRTGRFGQRGN